MVKQNKKKGILYAFLMVLIVSCASKNEYGRFRAKTSRFSIKATENPSVYQVIDTSSFYLLTSVDGKKKYSNDSDYGKEKKISNKGSGLKFYSNGRVGFFNSVILDKNEELDPRKAVMGYYQIINDEMTMEFLRHHVQSGPYISVKNILKSNNKELRIESYKKTNPIKSMEQYKRIKLDTKYLIYKPDW
jgi:hypothetical protein